MECKACSKCGASWINEQLYWSTGVPGKELDLASLVCNNLIPGDEGYNDCINPERGQKGGVTWEYRRGYMDGVTAELSRDKGDDK